MKKVAYLTMEDAGDFVTDYHLSVDPMAALGWQVETVPWRSAPDWDAFDAVYICTPWDYPEHLAEFLDVLGGIDASSALLINDQALVHWTLEKTYLRDIEKQGGRIVPSTWWDDFDTADVPRFFAEHASDKVVVEISSDGGQRYEALDSFSGFSGARSGHESYDISAFISDATQIRPPSSTPQ